MKHFEQLTAIYNCALNNTFNDSGAEPKPNLQICEYLQTIVSRSESNKAAVTVLTTLLLHKLVSPLQDIRCHQAGMNNGFAARGIDQAYVTPFMKSVSFPAMKESGWLTRSFEQPEPYTLNYKGKITPTEVKKAFLGILDMVQVQEVSAETTLVYLFTLLIKKRDSINIELAKPHSLSIASIMVLLEKHITAKYSSSGASRLPTLAIYAAYQCMMPELSRYSGKILCPLESHTSPDARSGRIGDIDVNNQDKTAFEGVEIKHDIVITKALLQDAYEKFKGNNTQRYYLLTTAKMDKTNWADIDDEIQRISNIHGCQVIVNGVFSSLKCYLRLLSEPSKFIYCYVEAMKADGTIKFEHKTLWNKLVSEKDSSRPTL